MSRRRHVLSDRCPLTRCNSRLDTRTDGLGRVLVFCPACERNARGLCRDCPASIRRPGLRRQNWPKRCATCQNQHRTDKTRKRYKARPDHYRMMKRRNDRKIRRDPEKWTARQTRRAKHHRETWHYKRGPMKPRQQEAA